MHLILQVCGDLSHVICRRNRNISLRNKRAKALYFICLFATDKTRKRTWRIIFLSIHVLKCQFWICWRQLVSMLIAFSNDNLCQSLPRIFSPLNNVYVISIYIMKFIWIRKHWFIKPSHLFPEQLYRGSDFKLEKMFPFPFLSTYMYLTFLR